MALILKATSAKNGSFENPEPGNQVAVLVAIVDLGTVMKKEFQKPGEKEEHEIYLLWELTAQQMTGSTHNHVVGRTYNFTLGEKSNLRKMLVKWRGVDFGDNEEFVIDKLLGQQCLLDVQPVAGKSYVKLDATPASRLPKGMTCPPAKRKPFIFELDKAKDDLPTDLDWLPFIYGEPVIDRIKRSKEWKTRGGGVTDKAVPLPGYDANGVPVDEQGEPIF